MSDKMSGSSISGQSEHLTPEQAGGMQSIQRLPWHKPGYHQIGVEEVKIAGSTILDGPSAS